MMVAVFCSYCRLFRSWVGFKQRAFSLLWEFWCFIYLKLLIIKETVDILRKMRPHLHLLYFPMMVTGSSTEGWWGHTDLCLCQPWAAVGGVLSIPLRVTPAPAFLTLTRAQPAAGSGTPGHMRHHQWSVHIGRSHSEHHEECIIRSTIVMATLIFIE